MSGYLVAFTLGGLAILVGFLGIWAGAFDQALFAALPNRFWGVLTNPVLVAVPLFVFMGVVLERSGIAESLLTTMGQVFGRCGAGLRCRSCWWARFWPPPRAWWGRPS
jgi:TRAP-type mannitol/chloroaromatic compound transport system permease large subunit